VLASVVVAAPDSETAPIASMKLPLNENEPVPSVGAEAARPKRLLPSATYGASS
jgi:hypothetical protein